MNETDIFTAILEDKRRAVIRPDSKTFLGIDARYTDEQIEAYVLDKYGWFEPVIIRQLSAVLVQPSGKKLLLP